MDPIPNAAILKELQADMQGRWPDVYNDTPRDNMQLRVYRAARWIEQAEKADSVDAAFIFYWIAFNAAYAEGQPSGMRRTPEETRFRWYFRTIVDLDKDRTIQSAIRQRFPHEIMDIMKNEHMFKKFWDSKVYGVEDNWQRELEKDRKSVAEALGAITMKKGKKASRRTPEQSTVTILSKIFTRLYVLRNQLMHGGATPRGRLNRKQVEDGKAIMAYLLPRFLSLMWTNIDLIAATADENWGRPPYPPVH